MASSTRHALAASLVGLLVVGPTTAAAEEILVASAVSLREPLAEIARRFERAHPDVRVRLSFGASSVLAAQVRAGAPIDLLVAADERIVHALAEDGIAGDPIVVAGNRLVVIQAEGAAARITSAEDLMGPSIRRIAVPPRAVPVGRYARGWLVRLGLLDKLAPRMVQTEHARATLAAVDAGDADAAIVYATDAQIARSARIAFELPAAEQPRIVYAAARIAEARQPEDADAFLDFLTAPGAQKTLAAAGFSTGVGSLR